jgi:hypothetical protein
VLSVQVLRCLDVQCEGARMFSVQSAMMCCVWGAAVIGCAGLANGSRCLIMQSQSCSIAQCCTFKCQVQKMMPFHSKHAVLVMSLCHYACCVC